MMLFFSRRLLRSIAAYQFHARQSGALHAVLRRLARLRHLFWSIVTASDIDPLCRIGSGLMLPHPNGVIFHGNAVIGDNCMIMQQVTVGMIGDGEYPVVGDNVYIGAGAKILGRVRVGSGSRIGAMAVVLEDVPEGCTAVGIPARVITRNTRVSSAERSRA
jgi:serine O-acetyltransferase